MNHPGFGIGNHLRDLRQITDFRLAGPVKFALIYQQQRLARPAQKMRFIGGVIFR